MATTFMYISNSIPNIFRKPLKGEDEVIIRIALSDLLENHGDFLLKGSTSAKRVKILGFYTAEYPATVGLLCYNPREDNPEKLKLYSSCNASSESPAVAEISLPMALLRYRAVACYLNDEHFPERWNALITQRVLKGLWTAALQIWKVFPDSLKDSVDLIGALFDAPDYHKRRVLHHVYGRLFDSGARGWLSLTSVRIPDARIYSNHPARVIFYMNKNQLRELSDVMKARDASKLRAPVIVFDNIAADSICAALRSIVTIDGFALLPLNKYTNLAAALERRTFFEVRQRMWDPFYELSWTLPYSFAEGHLTREEFERAVMWQMECRLCDLEGADHTDGDHVKLLYHQATLIGSTLRPDLYPQGITDITTISIYSREVHSGIGVQGALFHLHNHLFVPGMNPTAIPRGA